MASWVVPGYREVRELGRGGFGWVVEAVHVPSGRVAAIKYLKADLVADAEFLAGFRSEAALLTRLDVSHVVRLFDYVEEPGRGAAIVMELVDGASLHQLITEQGPTSPESALVVLKGSLLGLAAAHALGVVHGDYKPENVLVDTAGVSKLTDFGLATPAGRPAPAAGTPLYMAPEQWNGGAATPATDIYAATAVFFECLTGRTPFAGTLQELRDQHRQAPVPSVGLASPLRALVDRGMSKDPAHRPADARTFVAELEDAAAAAAGTDWEERGRSELAERAAALSLLLPGAGVVGDAGVRAATWLAHRKRTAIVATALALAAVLTVTGVAVGSDIHHRSAPGQHSHSITVVSQSAITATAAVTPSAVMQACATPTRFSNAATLTASQAGPVRYRWRYSSGKVGPAETIEFRRPGSRSVSGGVTMASMTGTGWAEVEVLSPIAVTSNKATYRLTCASPAQPTRPPITPTPVLGTPVITIALSTSPSSPDNVLCGTSAPTFTVTGQISSDQPTQVTYYWVHSDGSQSSPQTTSIGAGETVSVSEIVNLATDSYSGSESLDISAPVQVSNSIPITVTCTPNDVTSVAVTSVMVPDVPCSATGTITGSFDVTVDASTIGAVRLQYYASESSTSAPGSAYSSGTLELSGQTSYNEADIPVSFGSGCYYGYFVVEVTALGTFNQMTATGYDVYGG